MSFSCQLTLCREAESEGFLGSSRSTFCSYEFKAESTAGVTEDVDRNANNWATFEARSATEKPPSSSKSPINRCDYGNMLQGIDDIDEIPEAHFRIFP